MTSIENDVHLMDQTEKLVADMLKNVLTMNCHEENQNGLNVSQSIEYEIIDENGTKSKVSATNVVTQEATMTTTNENVFDNISIQMRNDSQYEDFGYENVTDLESYISDNLQKIRLEYPIYRDENNEMCGNWHNSPVSIMPAPSYAENSYGNTNIPYNAWCGSYPSHSYNNVDYSPVYQNEANRTVHDEECWRFDAYQNKQSSLEWNQSNEPLLKEIDYETHQSPDNDEETGSDDESNDEDDDENDSQASTTNDSNIMSTESSVKCIMTQHKQGEILCGKTMSVPILNPEILHLNVNNNINAVSNATEGLATTHVQICAGTPTGIHAAQRTTTTTTTAGGFGVLHHQTSCTTTNFVPNNLANAVLANNPAALYAQSILTSTAHQYLNVFRKEIQPCFTTNNHNNTNIYNPTAPTLNLGIYERLLYAQLLQILQQQQQQAAIATLLQQQKIALQNNAATIAAAAAAVTNIPANNYSNTNVLATAKTNGSSSSSNNNTGAGGNSLKIGASNQNSKKSTSIGKGNVVVNMPEQKNFKAPKSATSEDAVGTTQKSMLE